MNKKRCVIIAAGNISNNDIIANNVSPSDFVIAADAGYLKCISAGITPNLIVGDFDSSKVPETSVETIRLNPIKDSTDSETALLEAEKRGFKDILLLGATGRRLDHTIANIILTSAAKQRGCELIIIDEHHKIYSLKDETKIINKANSKYYLSVFSVGGDCIITEEGVYYPLNKYCLSPFFALGVSNEITEDNAKITVHSGTAVIIETDKF